MTGVRGPGEADGREGIAEVERRAHSTILSSLELELLTFLAPSRAPTLGIGELWGTWRNADYWSSLTPKGGLFEVRLQNFQDHIATPDLETACRSAAVRFLAFDLMNQWREKNALPIIGSKPPLPFTGAFRVEGEMPTTLRWESDVGEAWATFSSREFAARFTHYGLTPWVAFEQALTSPSGSPLFSSTPFELVPPVGPKRSKLSGDKLL